MDTLDTFLDTSKVAKVAQLFVCNFCHYSTTKKSNYTKHLATDKHKRIHLDTKMDTFATFNIEKVAKIFECCCGNIYKHSQGLSKHKKNCKKVAESSHSNECSKEEINKMN